MLDLSWCNKQGRVVIAAIDVTGERYGRLVGVRRVPSAGRRTKWLFRCDCSTDVVLSLETVRQGFTQSCGCLRKDVTRARSLTHGHRVDYKTTKTRKSYEHAKGRCFNPNDPKYPHYGGRGITMCEEWANGFTAFLRDMGECPPGKTLDRVDVNGHYEPRNCRWATTRQQARTRTDNVLVQHEGRQVILKDFAALMGVSYKALHARVRYRGQSAHEAADALRQRR
jgi:hypothetical protein